MERYFIAITTVSLLLLAGCSQAPQASAPADTRADEQAIRDNEAAWTRDWAAKDLDRIVSHYADDASLLVSGMPIMSGREAIRNGCKMLLADANLALSFMPVQVEIAKGADLAYSRGTYTMTMTDPGSKKAVTEKGKYITIYRKGADGAWKAIQDINNADAPPAPPSK